MFVVHRGENSRISKGRDETPLSAGHMIPIDQPKAALKMVDMIMKRHAEIAHTVRPSSGSPALPLSEDIPAISHGPHLTSNLQ